MKLLLVLSVVGLLVFGACEFEDESRNYCDVESIRCNDKTLQVCEYGKLIDIKTCINRCVIIFGEETTAWCE